MKFISIGGVGGCPVPQALSKANVHQERFPYDWLLANQTFVINTFEHIVFQPKDALHENMKTHFFDFENPEFVENTKFYTKSKNAFSIHDIEECGGYNIDVAHYIIEKYMRRFLRLMEIMEQKESLMFVRRSNVEIERKEWDAFFNNTKDDYALWKQFLYILRTKYQKSIYLVVLTENLEEYNENLHLADEYFIIKYYKNGDDFDIKVKELCDMYRNK